MQKAVKVQGNMQLMPIAKLLLVLAALLLL
jgi:hypothetical protein